MTSPGTDSMKRKPFLNFGATPSSSIYSRSGTLPHCTIFVRTNIAAHTRNKCTQLDKMGNLKQRF